jgi:DNA sulfur modification protein DndD
LGLDSEKNVNIIMGPNGAGKSNIMNAITWCLYGSEDHLDKYEGAKQSILNDAVLDKLEPGKNKSVRVRISFIDKSGRHIVFERTARVTRETRNAIIGTVRFKGFMEINRELKEIPEPNFMRDRFLPQSISSFFFFDGERLDDFFKRRSSQMVHEAIDEVSQLSLLESAKERLESTIKKMRGRLKNIDPKAVEIKDKIDAIEGGKESVEEDVAEIKLRISSVEEETASLSKGLRGSSNEVVKQLEARRDTLKRIIESAEAQRERSDAELLDVIVKLGPLLMLAPVLADTLELIQDKTQRGELPPRIKHIFVEELLQRGSCICGTDLAQGTARAEVEKLLHDVRISGLSQDLTEMKFHLLAGLGDAKKVITRLDKVKSRIADLHSEIQESEVELRDIDTQLQSVDSKEIADDAFKLTQLEEERIRLERKLAVKEETINNAKRRIDSLDRQLRNAMKDVDKRNQESDKLEIASEMLEIFQKIHIQLLNKTREQIEKRTREIFLSLIWKKETYIDVRINDSYRISVINNFNQDCLGSLSAGEREVLALSFLAALREISGFDAPILMDTPLARISKEPKESIARLLPKFFRNTQVTLLVTEEEYTPEVRAKLKSYVEKEYALKYQESELCTEVVDYV